MSREGRVSRVFAEVQRLITEYLERGISPSTDLLQQALYGDSYNSDSRIQQEVIYQCIMRGRRNVVGFPRSDGSWHDGLWDLYSKKQGEGGFRSDLEYTKNYEVEDCKKELDTQDFKDFHWELHTGRFGKDTKEMIEVLNEYPAVAIVFRKKMLDFSKGGNNLVIASKGKNSIWFIPSWWRWNIREYELYRQSLMILRGQLARGVKTKVLLPSGVPIERALEYESVVRAMLEDKTVWNCPKCGVRNLGTKDECVVCGMQNPTLTSSPQCSSS